MPKSVRTKFIALAITGLAWSWAGSAYAVGEETDMSPDYAVKSDGTRMLTKGDIVIRMLLEESNFGGSEIEIGEITFPVSYGQGGDHKHGKTEIFYVLSGKLGHRVNGGVNHVLEPGMVGVTREGDTVAHAVLSDEPVKALVIWLPAGEADRLIEEFGYSAQPVD